MKKIDELAIYRILLKTTTKFGDNSFKILVCHSSISGNKIFKPAVVNSVLMMAIEFG